MLSRLCNRWPAQTWTETLAASFHFLQPGNIQHVRTLCETLLAGVLNHVRTQYTLGVAVSDLQLMRSYDGLPSRMCRSQWTLLITSGNVFGACE